MASKINAKISGVGGVETIADNTGILEIQTASTTAITVNATQNITLANALPVGSGGTGLSTLTANSVILGNGTSSPTFVAPGTSGNVLTSNGTSWTSSAGGGGSSTITIDNKTAAYTIVAGDLGKVISYTGASVVFSLTAAATLGAGFNCTIWNSATNNGQLLTIDPNGAETIEGNATLILNAGEGTQIVSDGTNWRTSSKKTPKLQAESAPYGSYSTPTATGYYSIAWGDNARSTSSQTVAIGRATLASADSSTAIGAQATASGSNSLSLGRNSSGQGSNTTGNAAVAIAGSYAAGADSLAIGITTNSSSYGAINGGAIAIGGNARAGNAGALAIGYTSLATGNNSISLGYGAQSSGTNAVALGGIAFSLGPQATSSGSFAFGSGASSTTQGKFAFSPTDHVSGAFVRGVQSGMYIVKGTSTTTTPLILRTDGCNSTPNTSNQINLPTNSAYAFTGIIVARQQASAGTASAAWKIEGLIRKEGTDATTTLVVSTVTAISNVPGWTLALSADTTNGALAITATGTAINIRWSGNIQTSEVIY